MEEEVILINKVLDCDRYIAEAKINEGSYGEIFRVKHKQTGEIYALKAMDRQKLIGMHKMHEAAVEELILTKIQHPGIVKLFEIIHTKRYIGFVMDLCPFGDVFKLMRVINKHFELAKKKRKIMIYYIAQIIQVLDYLHSNYIVHRDLKPENIVIASDLKIRVIDFGTAKISSQNLLFKQSQIEEIVRIRQGSQDSTQLHESEMGGRQRNVSFVGTANYLSPQSINLNYSSKSDIWALGILAYKFYFNKLPYEGKDSIQIFKQIKINDLPLEKDVDSDIADFLQLTLCKDPEKRPSAAQLKKLKLFQGVSFKDIFRTVPPITKEELLGQLEESPTKKVGVFYFERALEKKMFFGNYKPRYLTIQKLGGRLMMAYRYIPSKKVKNQFELNMNDFAIAIKNNEFQITTTDKRYQFRVGKKESAEIVAEEINKVIRNGYALE